MSTLSIRLDTDLGRQLDIEVARRGTTRSKFVQEVLREALTPQHPLRLLQEARAEFGLPDPAAARTQTNKAADVKRLARKSVQRKQTGRG